MNIHLRKIHGHIKTHHKKYLLAGAIGGIGFFALKTLLLLFGIAGIFQRNQDTYALDSSICTEVLDVSQLECEALVGIYNDTKGDTAWAAAKRNTRGSTGNICGVRAGVGCDGLGSVISLNLNQFLLEGPIDLTDLKYLTYLNLGGNLQLGTISGLSNLSFLTYLDLSTINLQAKGIPSGLSSLVGLETISLQSNGLTSIPADLSQMVGLETIILSNNMLNSSNTPSISLPNLINLETLDLESNQFTTLPSISIPNIQTLKLAYNSSLYSIDNVVYLSGLETIDAKYCSIDSLPDIDNLTNLRFLNLYSNDIYNDGLNTFTHLSLPAGGDIRENCLTIYQTGGDSLYNYFTDHLNVQYNGQDTSCGHVYNTAPSCTAQYSHSTGVWTNSTVRATVSCNNSYSVRPADNISPSYWDFYGNSDGPYSFIISNSIWGRGDEISNVDFDWIDKEYPTCGTVTYTPGATAADPVTASVSCSDSPSGINVSQSVMYKQYPTNGTYTSTNGLYATDMAGNRTYVPVTIAGIIERYPVCSVSLTPNGRTSGSVLVSLINCSGQPPLLGDSRTTTLTQNGPYFTTISDGDGDEIDIDGTVSNIDKVAPTCNTISYSPAYVTGVYITGNVTATLIGCSDAGGPGSPTTPSGINGGASHMTYNFTDAGTHTLYVVDNAGNRTDYEAEVDWIDLGAPTCGVEYSISTATSGNVIATLTGCSESVTITNTINGELDYNFVNNGSFTFNFVDQAGNTGSTTATVSNIDRVAPTCNPTISYSPDSGSRTSGNVIASLSNCIDTGSSGTDSIFTGINSFQSNTRYEFSDNGFYTLYVVDHAGNRRDYTSQVTRIDKVKPVCGITHSVTGDFVNKSNQNVLSILTGCSESITVTNPIGGIGEYLFTENGEFTFEFVDAAGNTGIYKDVVYRIDTDAPRCTVNYSPSGATNGNVEASLGQCSKTNITVTNNSGSTGYTFTGNGNFTFEYIDDSGNTGFTVSTVTWIDREKPTCTINYTPNTSTSQNVLASIGLCSKQPIIVTNNSFLNNYLFTDNGNFTFEFRDALGNTGSTLATVTWISRGGGPTGRERDVCLDGDNSPSYYDGTCKAKETKVHGAPSVNPDICKVDKPYKFSVEQVISFQRAYSVGITTMCPIDKAGLNSNLIRKHMAKMISEFAMDVLEMEPDESKKCDFSDISKESTELRSYIKLACQLGLMGYKNDGITKKVAFEPNKVVSKAQFVAILSRLLWGTKYAGGENYFTKHANALKSHGILDRNISIFMVPQVRGPMLIMLMRAKVYLDALEKKSVLHTSAASTGSVTSGTKSSK